MRHHRVPAHSRPGGEEPVFRCRRPQRFQKPQPSAGLVGTPNLDVSLGLAPDSPGIRADQSAPRGSSRERGERQNARGDRPRKPPARKRCRNGDAQRVSGARCSEHACKRNARAPRACSRLSGRHELRLGRREPAPRRRQTTWTAVVSGPSCPWSWAPSEKAASFRFLP